MLYQDSRQQAIMRNIYKKKNAEETTICRDFPYQIKVK
jgi:hypothetical protein